MSQGSGSSVGHHSGTVIRQRLETSIALPSTAVKQACNQLHTVTTQSSSTTQSCAKEAERPKPAKESRSQKHTRVKDFSQELKIVVSFFPLSFLDERSKARVQVKIYCV